MKDLPHLLPSPAIPITGFDVIVRGWIVESAPSAGRAPLPLLKGKLVVDVAAQIRAVDDMDQPARHLIAAMLLPSGVEDIVWMMRFCDEHGIFVMSRNTIGDPDPGPIVRIHADALGRQRPMLRVVGDD
ncbi:hypothetical protein E2F46_02660 [Luteimonas aestuarii]|uniref:Uncharacterized protein n=1 Tax=Luteimonas aestuarii TaxID=453837 RepID=A0A4V3AMJ8_9GAMM|nr:hypothetical protein [Luteimonas aestuarii]TDK27133.1 hypothetical protein E2F46_02660 [Luteimonas aestuarii]